MASTNFATPPPENGLVVTSFPAPHVVIVTLNQPERSNVMNKAQQEQLHRALSWIEKEPSLWVIILTGAGDAFCYGGDLSEWSKIEGNPVNSILATGDGFTPGSRLRSSKPIIAAVNGLARGSGTEFVLMCDIVVASRTAAFMMPEVLVGHAAVAGGIQRLARLAGHQHAAEFLFTGKSFTAEQARDRFRFVNRVVAHEDLMPTALKIAADIVAASPDAVQSTKDALLKVQQYSDYEEAYMKHIEGEKSQKLYEGENIKEGMIAVKEQRKPNWQNPKL